MGRLTATLISVPGLGEFTGLVYASAIYGFIAVWHVATLYPEEICSR